MSNLTKVEHRKPGADQHVYIGTPAHTIYANFHVSLLRNVLALVDAGVGVTYAHLSNQPHVDDCRNLLVADFLRSSATDLLFIDADVAAEPGAALRLLSYNVDIVGGVYPAKEHPARFSVKPIVEPWIKTVPVEGLVECYAAPTGFLRLRRHAVEDMTRRGAEMLHYFGQEVAVLFERGHRLDDEGRYERVGGDYNFCTKVRDLGFRIYVDPSLLFTHAGVVDFAGRLSDHLGAEGRQS